MEIKNNNAGRLRILMVTKTRQNRGNYMRLYPLASQLAATGCEVTLLFAHEFRNTKIEVTTPKQNLKLVALPKYSDQTTMLDMLRRTFSLGSFLRRELSSQRYDIIHVCSPAFPDTWLATIMGKIANVPLLVDVDDLWGFSNDGGRNPVEALLEEALIQHGMRTANKLVVGSEFLKEKYRRVSDKPIEILWNGIEPDLFSARSKVNVRKKLAGKFGIGPNHEIIAAILDTPQLDLVASATSKLEHKGRKIAVLALGYHPDSEYPDDGTDHIKEGSIYKLRRMFRSDFLDYLLGSDLLLFTMGDSEWERARPLIKVPEFLASGTPLISFPVGETKIMLENAGYGKEDSPFYFELEPGSLARSIDFCMENEKVASTVASAAKDYVHRELTWERLTSRLLAIYHELVRTSGKRLD